MQHLALMLSWLHPLLRRQQLHYTVYVIEQVTGYFNIALHIGCKYTTMSHLCYTALLIIVFRYIILIYISFEMVRNYKIYFISIRVALFQRQRASRLSDADIYLSREEQPNRWGDACRSGCVTPSPRSVSSSHSCCGMGTFMSTHADVIENRLSMHHFEI